MVVIGLLLFVIVCELAAIYDRQNGGTGGVSKGLNAVKAGMTRISAQVSKMGDSAKSSFQRQITAITGLYQNYEKQERKVSELKSKLEELSKVRIETEEYKKLKDDIKALEDEFEKVETKKKH